MNTLHYVFTKGRQGVLGIILACCVFSSASAGSFSDVPSSHPQYKAIESLSSKGIVRGYKNGTFGPNTSVNRVEALKMILEASQTEITTSSNKTGFSDVPTDQWFAPFVATAKAKNIVSGNGDTKTFSPARTVQKSEFLKMALLAFNSDVSKHQGKSLIANDVPQDAWFAPYMSYARTLLIISPDSANRLHPSKTLTRAECAQILYQILILEQGGAVQKNLRLAESELLSVLLSLTEGSVSQARSHMDSAVFYAELAIQKDPNQPVVQAAYTITLALADLVSAYESGTQNNLAEVKKYALLAKEKAGQAYVHSPATQPIGKKIKQYADSLLQQVQ